MLTGGTQLQTTGVKLEEVTIDKPTVKQGSNNSQTDPQCDAGLFFTFGISCCSVELRHQSMLFSLAMRILYHNSCFNFLYHLHLNCTKISDLLLIFFYWKRVKFKIKHTTMFTFCHVSLNVYQRQLGRILKIKSL